MATKARAQIALDDKIVNNPEVEELLEKRESLKAYTSQYRKADKDAKVAVQKVKTPMPFRIGRFIISETTRQGREVSFETQTSTSISIKTADR